MMRNCHLGRTLLIRAIRNMSFDYTRWPADGLWYTADGVQRKCDGFLCTADGFCRFKGDTDGKQFEYYIYTRDYYFQNLLLLIKNINKNTITI